MYSQELREKIANVDQEKRKEISEFIQNSLADMLDIQQDEIQPDSYLIYDLGMGSLDFLDLTFRLEGNFEIQVPRNKILESIYEVIPKERFVQGGFISEEGIAVLKEVFGDSPRLKSSLRENQISELFTVKTFVDLTLSQLLNMGA